MKTRGKKRVIMKLNRLNGDIWDVDLETKNMKDVDAYHALFGAVESMGYQLGILKKGEGSDHASE
jgi:hypothetical protein